MTGGRVYLSAATVAAVGTDFDMLTPELVTGIASVLGISADDLSALTGVESSDRTWPATPRVADLADLIWEVRRLTAGQVRTVCELAMSMQEG